MKKLLVIMSLLLAPLALSQTTEEIEDAVTDRQAVFKLISLNLGPIVTMIRGGEFSEDAFVKSAERIAMLAEMIPEVFVLDTHGKTDLPSRASDIIWQNHAGFLSTANGLIGGANEAIKTIQNQGESGLSQAFDQLRSSCGDCHDNFRL